MVNIGFGNWIAGNLNEHMHRGHSLQPSHQHVEPQEGCRVSSRSSVGPIHVKYREIVTDLNGMVSSYSSSSWNRVLLETLDAKQKTGEWEMDNPLRLYESYYSVPPRDRVLVLKALVEWVLQEGASIRQGIEDYNEAYMVEPFGTDQQKRIYWYFGGKYWLTKQRFVLSIIC